MQMTEAFATTVAVTVPIFALAAGAEARGIRERLRRPDPQWEQEFAAYNAEHELDLSQAPSEVFAYLRGVPGVSALYKAERAMAIAAAIVWLVVFLLLGITEMRCLLWLGDGATPADPGLAQFSAFSIGLAMVTLIVAPVAYLLVPIGISFDVIPHGLKQAVGPKLSNASGRGFVKQVFTELEGAIERASENYTDKPAGAASREPDQEPGGGPIAEASGPNAAT